ncbi:Protein kinase domain-containing protein [Mycena venus]|uniref:non-specific serine/threonine protein kinase n=1 Tax=Mycena venus TaxID=2733690 RepID=A0A8H6Y0T7_9AGAR|nr:Protein kinase domain-containing protein [Mycena venus]
MSYFGAGASSPIPNLKGTFVDDGFFQLVQHLGSGRTAEVYHALDITSREEDPIYYAVKCMRNDAPGSKRVAALRNEFSIHKSVSHLQGVVTFHGVFSEGEEGELLFMVLDAASTNMFDAIVKCRLYVDRPALIKKAFYQVLDAVEECHDAGVYHRDLKPANILCNNQGTGIRLADFGSATRDEESTGFKCGSLAYMSPESVDPTRAIYSSRQSDLWAVAMILFALITGTTPWPVADLSDPRYAAFRAEEANYLIETFHLTRAAASFFRWCFALEPAHRPSIDEMYHAVRDMQRFSLAHTSELHSVAAAAVVRAHRPVAPDFRFVDRGKMSVTTRQRFASKMRRVY